LQLLTCNLFGGAGVGDDLATVGRVFSNFFHHEGFLDVVPSDVMAGFLLVRFQQKITKIRVFIFETFKAAYPLFHLKIFLYYSESRSASEDDYATRHSVRAAAC
jgi:hypothetical protein